MDVETPAQTQPLEQQQLASAAAAGVAAKPLHRNPRLVLSFVLMVVGWASGPLLLRTYFLHGGNRKWLSSLLQTAGWPLLLAPLTASFLSRRRCSTNKTPVFFISPLLLAASVVVGIMTGLDNLLYAFGLDYLPVSTSSVLMSTQLAFTAGFALVLVRQRFTAFSVNAVVLLSVGAAMLGMNGGGDRPAGVTRVQYYAGFGLTLGAAALYGLMLPVIELSQARHVARARCAVTYTLVMEMQVVIGFSATVFSIIGMIVNNDFHAIPREAQEFGLGKAGYYVLLVGAAIMYQLFCLGIMGAVFYGSALLGGVIMTVLIPVTEVLAVLFFHEPFNGIKGIAVALSVWGFVSYFYGEIQIHAQSSNKPSNAEKLDL
ncbi:hypothetical protein QYE76_016923 [Lolium multiflorum]|uniref:Probable purine permease n=1 Tax=Lolium multiflorum TaxID=4521 RepID=A0AAD8Q4I3_LOLMU|nr:hypothetical protein QYE76_016923 [Lolium multiflorum]